MADLPNDTTLHYAICFDYKKAVRLVGRYLFLAACSFVTAWLVYASFPKKSIAMLAWIAWTPFIWGVSKLKGFWSSFFYGGFTGFLFHSALLYWVYYTCVHGGGLSVGLSVAAWLGLSALLSVQTACLGGCCYYLKETGPFFPFLIACGFVALEWLHQLIAFYGIGFPWFMWGYTQWNVPAALQLAAYAGTYGVGFVLFWTSASLGMACSTHQLKHRLIHVLVACVLCMVTFGWGKYRLADATAHRPSLLNLSAALLQPNIDQYKKWDPAFEQEITDTLAELGQEISDKNIRLAVWPESTLPGDLLDEKYFTLMKNISSTSASFQVIGSPVYQDRVPYVGAYLMAPSRDTLQYYRKVKRVPFGEYLPAAGLVRSLFPQADILGENGDFSAGPLKQPLLNADGVLLGSTICYEAIFPQIWQYQTRQGAKLFVNLTNDAWFFDTAAPYQHLSANILRAVETGRPVLRAANTGISAVISPLGHLEQHSDLFTRTVLHARIPLMTGTKQTVYTQYGDWFAWVCAALFFTTLISSMVFAYE